VFLLKQKNLDHLKDTLDEVSNPKNPRYGNYLSLDQVADMVAPSKATTDSVIYYLKSQGIQQIFLARSRDMLIARVSSTLAARIFDTQFAVYRHEMSGNTISASVGPYSLPSSIAQHIDFVSGIVGFPDIAEKVPAKINPSPAPTKIIDPVVIRARYNISSTLVVTNSNNSHAVAEFQAQYYSPTDLQSFWTQFVPFAPLVPISTVVGYNNPKSPGIEASLDVQYITGVAPNATTWFYSMKNFNFWNDLVAWYYELNNETSLPWVHSISYGSQGDYPTNDYQFRFDVELQKVGLRGVSIIFASGDSGSGCSSAKGTCGCTFYPSFPATTPHVTSVGATRFLAGNTGDEGAVQAFLSGGGFSDTYPLEDWQASAVNAYLALNITQPPTCAFNGSGRATPDVSALGDIHFQVINGGQTIPVGGTSASSPTFAAVITLLNDIRLNAGKPTLGFLNPWIYQTAASTPDAFYDVVNGNNAYPGCCKGGLGGFNTAPGWDPATGVGTPNFAVLSQVVSNL